MTSLFKPRLKAYEKLAKGAHKPAGTRHNESWRKPSPGKGGGRK